MLFIPAVTGFWADYYACKENNIVDTINYMLSLHADDFPNTCCVGLTVTRHRGLVKIWPKVKNKEFTYDYYTNEKI